MKTILLSVVFLICIFVPFRILCMAESIIKRLNLQGKNNIYKQNHNNKNLFDEFVSRNYYSKDDEADFIDIVTKNISTARFLLMIVGDGIREGVEKMVSFLNSNPTMQYRFALCELEIYELPNGERLVIPNLRYFSLPNL